MGTPCLPVDLQPVPPGPSTIHLAIGKPVSAVRLRPNSGPLPTSRDVVAADMLCTCGRHVGPTDTRGGSRMLELEGQVHGLILNAPERPLG